MQLKAIIFNSGYGKRMGSFTQHHHKSMAMLSNGETLFERQLRILQEHGITQIIVTTGPHREQLIQKAELDAFSDLNVTFVHNPEYQTTNYIYSMYLAREYFDDDVLLLHGDLVFNRRLIAHVLQQPHPDVGMVHPTLALPQKDFKARVTDSRILEVSVNIFDPNCFAFQPLYRLSRRTLHAWSQRVQEFIECGERSVYADDALNTILPQLDLRMLSYADHYIDEVDTLEDLERVCAQIRQFDFDEQDIALGKDAPQKIADILNRHHVSRPMLVTDKIFDQLSISGLIRALPYQFTVFDAFSPNPQYEEVAQGVELFRRNQCDFILSVGGGSAIDTAKNIKLFSILDPGPLYFKQAYRYHPVKHLAIPSTAGTGSESTRFSVLYYNGEKQSIAHDSIVPEYVILDPTLLTTLPDYQKKCTSLDALCQCIEAIWSINANQTAQQYGQAGLKLILAHLSDYLSGSSQSATQMALAANYSGKAINIAQTTAPHAMSYKLSSQYRIPHGHAVALCLPCVWRYMIQHAQDALHPDRLSDAMQKIDHCFGSTHTMQSVEAFEALLQDMKLPSPSLDCAQDLDVLTQSVNPVRLGNSPVPLEQNSIRECYRQILSPDEN